MAKKRIVFITGCSSGIGKRLIQEFSRDEFVIIATVRPTRWDAFREELSRNQSEVVPYLLDVTDLPQAADTIKAVESDVGPIDILINNAGISFRTALEEMDEEDEQLQMATNYFGPMQLIRQVLPGMRKRKSGHIINISSVGGMMAMPTMSAYSASKFALEGASEALWYEVKPYNIKVSLVRPGFINSNAFRRVRFGKHSRLIEPGPYAHHYRHMTTFVEKLMTRTPCTPESVARTIHKISRMKNPPLRISGTPDARFFEVLRRLLPRRFYHWLLYRSLPGIREWGNSE